MRFHGYQNRGYRRGRSGTPFVVLVVICLTEIIGLVSIPIIKSVSSSKHQLADHTRAKAQDLLPFHKVSQSEIEDRSRACAISNELLFPTLKDESRWRWRKTTLWPIRM
jgi:hypothetical protein